MWLKQWDSNILIVCATSPQGFEEHHSVEPLHAIIYILIVIYQDPQGVVHGHPLTSKGLSIEAPWGVLVYHL